MSEQLQSSLNIGSQDSHINLAKASPVLFPRKNIANYFKSISSRAFYSLTINKITKKNHLSAVTIQFYDIFCSNLFRYIIIS